MTIRTVSSSKLEFALKFQNGEVEYKDGKVTLTIPAQLKGHKTGSKSLLGDIKNHFEDIDNLITESLIANIGEGPKSFIVDPPAEVDSGIDNSFDIIPENSVFDLGNIAELVKKAVDAKDVNALGAYIDVVQTGVTHMPPEEGLSVVRQMLEIIDKFAKEEKLWYNGGYPTVPGAAQVYHIAQQTTRAIYSNISNEDCTKLTSFQGTLCKIESDLINVINVKGTPDIINETATSSRAVDEAGNERSQNPELESTDSQQVIDKAQKTINEHNDDGFTPLHVAAQKGDVELGRRLLQCGANIEITSKVDGDTASYLAVRNGHKGFVELLLDNGTNVSSVSSTDSRVTLLHEAAFHGHVGVAELLIEHGATVDAKDRHNFTPLMYASAQGNSAMVELLLQKKADLYLQNNTGETALHSAADYGYFDTASILISAAKDKEKYVNTQSWYVGTALHIIAYNREINEGHKKVAKLLLDNGTSPYLENDPIVNAPRDTFWKENSLSIAKKQGNKEFLELMASWGYSVTIDDTPSNSNKSNTAPQNTQKSKLPVVAWTLAIAGVLAGAAAPAAYFAFSVSLLVAGITASVGACCLIAAAIVYCCTPKSQVENSNVETVKTTELTAE